MSEQSFFAELAAILEVDPVQVNEGFAIFPADWDSVARLSTIALVDEKFGVTIPTGELNACTTVGSLLRLAERLAAAAGQQK
jgi:acyl carrier protein